MCFWKDWCRRLIRFCINNHLAAAITGDKHAYETMIDDYLLMPSTLWSTELSRRTFRYFRNFPQAEQFNSPELPQRRPRWIYFHVGGVCARGL